MGNDARDGRIRHSDSAHSDIASKFPRCHTSTTSYPFAHNSKFFSPHCGTALYTLFVVSPISVGYLFVLIAHQRALRLSHAVYRQLSAIAMCSHRVTQDVPPTSTSANEAKPRLTLVEVFRNYLNEHYDRNTSDYLRAEYEFISGFLDVLSQSTNLLYQVQKLKLVCSAAAAAQAKKTELYRDLHVTIPGKSNFDATVKAGSSHAVSVEGKHGILIRKSSGDQPDGSSVLTSASSTVHANRRTGVGHTNIMSQYQDTLHRACTFDRYVATGSILCPLNTTDPESSSEVNRIQTSTDVGLTSSNVPTEHSAANPTSKPSVKKAVQWSDYREISTRHQVIGRFLEMVWRYTETLLNNLFLCPPPQAIVGAQASSGLSLQSTQPVLGSVSLVLTNCLQMSTDKLRRLVCHIREVAKSDIFPVGLVPVLKKQALKLDELAHLRCYYTELSELIWHHRMMTSGHMCNLTNAPDVLNTDTGPNGTNRCDSTGSTPVTALGAAECASRTVCALSHVLSSNDTGSLSANRRGLYAPSVRLDVTSLLHLLLSCLHHFASVDPGHLNQLTTWVTQYTKVLDLPSDFESNVIVSNQQQLLASVQSSYDLSRRLCMVTQRLTSSLSVWAMFCTLRLKITMQTLVQHASESTNCTLHDSLRSAIHLMVVHLAEFTRVRSLIDLLQTLVDSLSHNLAQRFPFLNNTALTSRYDGDPRRSKTSTSPGRSDTRPPVRLDFPNWIRTAKLLCSLKHVNHSLVTLLNEMWVSCNSLMGNFLSNL
ncbi:hypothetical protein AHF37_01195 [Paragonimus kellicotti]|nr:hypothetical protein AHF37_01195 [Paragonimus kellicotti]